MITFYRRKALSISSGKGMAAFIEGCHPSSVKNINWRGTKTAVIRNDRPVPEDTQLLVRLGVTTPTGVPLEYQVNRSEAIHRVNDKSYARTIMQDVCPHTIFDVDQYEGQRMIVRPCHHAQGKNLWVINSLQELVKVTDWLGDNWYASEYIPKVAEYRVYVMSGRVITVAQKTPDNPDAVAWNVHQGGRFDVVPWGEWPLEACRVATEGMSKFDLDFGGVDVMLDADGKAYVIEINSAPSLPFLSDGSISYRQKCMAKGFMHMLEHGRNLEPVVHDNGWRGYIHPAIWKEKL